MQKAINKQQLEKQQSNNAEQQIEGQKLEKQTTQAIKPNNVIYYSLFGIFLLIACGAIWQSRRKYIKQQQIYLLTTKSNLEINKAA